MDSLLKILGDCQSLLDKRDSRIKRLSTDHGGPLNSEAQPVRFEVLVFEGRRASDLTDTQPPFDREALYHSEKKLPRSRERDLRLYSSEAKQPPRMSEDCDTRPKPVHRADSPTQAFQSVWRTGPSRRAAVLCEAPDEMSCSSIFIAEDSKLRLSGVNTRSHLEFGPSFRLKTLQGSAAILGSLSRANQKKQRMARERPESPSMIALEELSRDQFLQSVGRQQQPSRKRNPSAAPNKPDRPAPKSHQLRFESPERKIVRILKKDCSAEDQDSTHPRFTTTTAKKRDILRPHLGPLEGIFPKASAGPPGSATGNVVITHSSIKPKRSRPLSAQKDKVYDLSGTSVAPERKHQSRKNSPSLATTHASVYNIGKMHDYETPHLRQLFAARRDQMVKQLGLRSPDGWPGWTRPEDDTDACARSGTLFKAFSEDLDASKQPLRFRPEQTELDLCRMEAGEESLGFLIRGNGEKYSFQCKKLF